ncbi:MAG: molybdopterin molybdenumtransferase MoeA [Clostridia bacterium]|nr:molybdopterin molybdenumtransferase MoeA [Clostridia bacterium]
MLKVVSSEEAFEIINNNLDLYECNSERVSLYDSLGRVLSEDIISGESIPPFNRSTVDGYAVRSSDTYGCGESMPAQLDIIGEILMGENADKPIKDGQCIKISTGGMLPAGADSVVMVEHTDCSFDSLCLAYKAVSPFENVTRKGDDIKVGDTVLRKGTVITSREIGILASLGVSEVSACIKPRVGIISTGDEIVPIDGEASPGKIRDINSHILSALMREKGCECKQYGIVKDDYDEIYAAVVKAVEENDIVLISGGSSAGTRDMTAQIIGSLGEVYAHGIAVKPGKPTIIGKIDGKAVFGLPGHPAASYFVCLRFIVPLVKRLLGCIEDNIRVKSNILQNISSNHGREEIVCVRITDRGAEPVFGKSGVISLLSESDGYIIIDRNREGLKSGETVEIHLF